LVDDLTGDTPVARIEATLYRDDGGKLVETDIRHLLTPAGILTYPALGRSAEPGNPPRAYQVRLSSKQYLPLYRATSGGIDFLASPYDDNNPPAAAAASRTVPLLPSPAYPFAAHQPVLHGAVTVGGNLTPDVLVSWGGAVNGNPVSERTLTDSGGSFALPLRWASFGVPIQIDADFTPPGAPAQSGSISVTLPGALASSQLIAIP
jgi:hypothetical protein